MAARKSCHFLIRCTPAPFRRYSYAFVPKGLWGKLSLVLNAKGAKNFTQRTQRKGKEVAALTTILLFVFLLTSRVSVVITSKERKEGRKLPNP
jgi:hypothetical protein